MAFIVHYTLIRKTEQCNLMPDSKYDSAVATARHWPVTAAAFQAENT